MPDTARLRQSLRQRRQRLDAQFRRQHAETLCAHFGQHDLFRHSRHTAFYQACHGEADPAPLLAAARAGGRHCYLPRLHEQQLQFLRVEAGETLRPNRFGIAEPAWDPLRLIANTDLDLVLLPLVAFDAAGSRLGMGGGYYDRSFAFRRQAGGRPWLIGLAYAFQEVPQLHRADWDVPLDGVLTELGLRLFRTG